MAGAAEEAAVLQQSGPRVLDASLLWPVFPAAPTPSSPPGVAELTVVVPTRDERENISPLIERLETACPRLRPEVLFVDDSDDDTPHVIRALAARSSRRVGVIHRAPDQRDGGLGGAVLAGLRAARSEWICVMDGDLQHPPELLGALLEEARRSNADVVVASRYCPGGDVGDFSALRTTLSRSSASLARALFPRCLGRVSDPLSGFFLIRRAAVDLTCLRPRGFKILLEILVRGGPLTTSEIPFRFGERYAGESKASLREGILYLHRLIELRGGRRRNRAGPAPTVAGPSVTSDRPWRFRHRAPAVWNRNGKAGGDHATAMVPDDTGSLTMRCPQCGAETRDEEWNCASCRMNVYWASQHYEDLARIRRQQGLPATAGTPGFLVQAHAKAMDERALHGGRVEHKVRQIARLVMRGQA
jgi:glycosyltransferase involved in cell wall biosynthesis